MPEYLKLRIEIAAILTAQPLLAMFESSKHKKFLILFGNTTCLETIAYSRNANSRQKLRFFSLCTRPSKVTFSN